MFSEVLTAAGQARGTHLVSLHPLAGELRIGGISQELALDLEATLVSHLNTLLLDSFCLNAKHANLCDCFKAECEMLPNYHPSTWLRAPGCLTDEQMTAFEKEGQRFRTRWPVVNSKCRPKKPDIGRGCNSHEQALLRQSIVAAVE
jgi:hypothetical protein